MSKIKKALERSRALREQGDSVQAVLEREQPGLSEREQLEYDIYRLLSNEYPEILGSVKKQIKLSYSKTKIIKTDPEILINNRVFAIKQDFEITKHIEMLRAQVLKKLKQINANSLMITSANPREGKTFISTNLAVSIAQNFDRTVMLIDADLRKRSYKRHNMETVFFNSNSWGGLSDYLTGSAKIEELLVNPGIPRLTILPSGKELPDSAAFLGSPKMEDMVYEMKSRYPSERILIFDCSSFLSSADSLILSKFVDAVLLVVENEKTEINALQRMTELLKDKIIVGTVMNKSRGSFNV